MQLKTGNWVVYMLLCNDGTIYTGITNNLENRLKKHNSGKGAKYTKNRLPVRLMTFWGYYNKSEASKIEYQYKQLNRVEKLKLIEMTNDDKARLYDDYIRQSEVLQRENSKLKSEFTVNMPDDKQKIINDNDAKIKILVKKLEDLYNQA